MFNLYLVLLPKRDTDQNAAKHLLAYIKTVFLGAIVMVYAPHNTPK